MTVDELLAASRHLTLSEQSRLLAALAQQIAAAVASASAATPAPPAAPAPPAPPDSWEQIIQLVEQYGVATGIGDLAHQHDHYLYGTPRRATGE